tara:strand:- start:745 stop:906 length:162 start_codon:yes stop_codon:yes gene_type:complete
MKELSSSVVFLLISKVYIKILKKNAIKKAHIEKADNENRPKNSAKNIQDLVIT